MAPHSDLRVPGLSFDLHQHLWPEPFLAALSRRSRPPRLRGRQLELAGAAEYLVDLEAHSPERRLALLDRDGVDVAVVSLQPTLGLDQLPGEERGPLVDAYHDGIHEVVAGSGGRLRALAYGAALDGFAGASLTAAGFAEALGAGTHDPLLAELAERKLPLFVHPGPAVPPRGAPAWWPEVVAYTAEMQEAWTGWLAHGAPRHPRLRVVFAILAGGGPVQLERLASRGVPARSALHETVFFDTASYGRRALELCLSTFGVRQLVYGSDAPVIDSTPTLQALAVFGEAVSDAVRRENPSLVLG